MQSAGRLRKAGAIVLASLALAACVKEPSPGVTMTKMGADLAFGFKPPATVEPVTASALIQLTDQFREEPLNSFARPRRPAAPASDCPEAGPTEFPEQEAPNRVTGRPQVGDYRWLLSGTYKPPNFPFPIGFKTFVKRSVRNLANAESPTFSFDTVEPDSRPGSNRVITQSFAVDSTGVRLASLTSANKDGSDPRVFSPVNPVTYLPLPVQAAASFDSTGIDVSRGTTMQHTGVVKDRFRIDACGTVVEGWLIEATQTLTTLGQPARKKYNYVVAPQFGGLIIYEHVEDRCVTTTSDGKCSPDPELVYDTNIGQVKAS